MGELRPEGTVTPDAINVEILDDTARPTLLTGCSWHTVEALPMGADILILVGFQQMQAQSLAVWWDGPQLRVMPQAAPAWRDWLITTATADSQHPRGTRNSHTRASHAPRRASRPRR